jgi:SPP1 gp7 family putative phage head morphogenesis protein
MGMAEVLGASMVLREAIPAAEATVDRTRFAKPKQTLVPKISLTAAVEAMVEKTPVTLRSAAERTAQRISQLYGEKNVVAFAKSAEAAVTKRAQALIAEGIKQGLSGIEGGRRLAMGVNEIRKRTAAWTEGYARMAYRTNVNTAVTAGRFRQVQDQDIRKVIPAFRFAPVGDEDTRDNHMAGNGKILRVDNLAWNRLAPPLGYSCRCQVQLVSLPQLRRMDRVNQNGTIREDRIPRAWHPDEGFRHGGRPDLFVGRL